MFSARRRRWMVPGSLLGLLLLTLVAGSEFVSATYGEGGAEPPPVSRAAVPEGERARIQVVDTIPVVRVTGSPREMGRQHGTLLRKQIEFLRREYVEAMVVPMVGRARLKEWAKAVEPYLLPHYREELKGLADGAGLTYDEALTVNAMVDRMQAMMCSAVVAAGDATRDGEIYFGRNLDFPGRNLLQRMSVVIVFEPDGGTPVAAVTWPGFLGVLSGMNRHGVAVATMMIHRGEELQAGLPYPLLYREALARARRTSDVYPIIAAARRTCPNNLMVVDATGAAEVVEFDARKVARRPAIDGTICATNHFRSEELHGSGWLLGVKRYKSLAAFLEAERGKIDLDAVRGALRDVASPWYLNVQSMVFLPARRALHLSVGGKLPAADQRFVHLDEKTLFGAEGKRR